VYEYTMLVLWCEYYRFILIQNVYYYYDSRNLFIRKVDFFNFKRHIFTIKITFFNKLKYSNYLSNIIQYNNKNDVNNLLYCILIIYFYSQFCVYYFQLKKKLILYFPLK